jgi:EAL domain-containing protein (putative c-di-GMP-specific phosphodiesterase class I)
MPQDTTRAVEHGLSDFFNPAAGPEEDSQGLLAGALTAIRKHLRMDVAFLSEFTDGRRVFRAVNAQGPTPVSVGGSDALEDSYCQRVVDGRLPEVIQDAKSIAEAAALPVTAALPVGAHMSVPVRRADGSVYGTFCCFSSTPDHTLNERDLAVMRVFAEWIGGSLDKDSERSHERTLARQRIETLIAGSALTSVYQPIYTLADHSISGFECLSRISTQPIRGPDVWFREAAMVGLGNELEMKAIKTGLEGIKTLPENVYVSVNASPRLLSQRAFQAVVSELPAARVVIELTEHETISEYKDLLTALRSFRERGVRIAVDDAGAGYSSFRHILEIMPAFIKLDISLTRGIDQDPARRALAAAMVRFGRDTNSAIVAEGIETEEELLALGDLGVTAGQGYFLQRPQPIEVARSLVMR